MRTEDLELKFRRLKDGLNEADFTEDNWKLLSDWLHFFEGGIHNLKGEYYELAGIAFFAIADSIGNQDGHDGNYNRIINSLLYPYTHGGRNFDLAGWKLERKPNSADVYHTATFKTKEEALETLKTNLRELYEQYRCPSVHEAKRFNGETYFLSELDNGPFFFPGGGGLRLQDFGDLVLDVLSRKIEALKK